MLINNNRDWAQHLGEAREHVARVMHRVGLDKTAQAAQAANIECFRGDAGGEAALFEGSHADHAVTVRQWSPAAWMIVGLTYDDCAAD